MPEFFEDPQHTPDPAAFRSGVEREARRRHARRVVVTSASAAVVLVATGVGVGLAAAGSGSTRTVPIDVAAEPTSPVPSASVDSSGPSATPTPTPTPSGGSTPVADTTITVYADCQKPTFEPTEIMETCGGADYGLHIVDIHWSTWTREKATGVGTYRYNDCNPNCAQGHFHDVPNTTVTLTEPKPDATGQLVYTLIATENANQSYSVQNSPEPLPTGSM